jgi:membrane protein YqaA with SNARE-associated domain
MRDLQTLTQIKDSREDALQPGGLDSRPARGRSLLRRLYDWVLSWADTPYGTPALFGIAFAESSFFPIPPDVLQIALSVSKPRRSFYYAAVSGVGSVLGALFGWFVGFALWWALADFFYRYVPGCTPENIARVGELYRDNAFIAILGAAFSPIPYKVFTIAAGVFHEYVSLQVLIVASILGRFGRFMSVAACIYFLGPGIRSVLERYFDTVMWLLLILLVAGFVALKWLL